MYKKLYYWLPPLIWMGVIFYVSSRPRISITENSLYAFLIFKTLHLIEYALLYFLLFRALYSLKGKNFTLGHKFLLAFIVSALYGLSDEIHQAFVPTREGRLRDVFIDSGGALLMYIYIKGSLTKLKKTIL